MCWEQVYKPATPENKRAEVIFLRKYDRGVLKAETVLRVADYDLRRAEVKGSGRARTAEKRTPIKVGRTTDLEYAGNLSQEKVGCALTM